MSFEMKILDLEDEFKTLQAKKPTLDLNHIETDLLTIKQAAANIGKGNLSPMRHSHLEE